VPVDYTRQQHIPHLVLRDVVLHIPLFRRLALSPEKETRLTTEDPYRSVVRRVTGATECWQRSRTHHTGQALQESSSLFELTSKDFRTSSNGKFPRATKLASAIGMQAASISATYSSQLVKRICVTEMWIPGIPNRQKSAGVFHRLPIDPRYA